jgi:cell division septum initiation protein DivIVA
MKRVNPASPESPFDHDDEGPAQARVSSADVAEPAQDRERAGNLARDLTLYVGARVLMIAIVAAVLVLAVGVPLLVSLAVAVVVALPLSLVLLRGLNSQVSRELAHRGAGRRAERDRLRAQLRGADEDTADEDYSAEGEAQRGPDAPHQHG